MPSYNRPLERAGTAAAIVSIGGGPAAQRLCVSQTFDAQALAEDDPPSPYLDRIVRMMETLSGSLRRGFLGLDLSQHLGRPVYVALLQTKLKLTATYAVALPHAGPSELGQPEALADVLDEIRGRSLVVRSRPRHAG